MIVSSQKQVISIEGQIYSPSMVRYIPGKSLKYYINNAGGFSRNAKRNNVYIVYSNGKVSATKNFLFFKIYPKVKPGATILVPEKGERRRVTAQEVVGITTGIATLGVLIMQLIK